MVESDIDILDRRLISMDMTTGDNKEIYFPTQPQLLLGNFAIRKDGTIIAEIYNRDTKEMEYRKISIGEDEEIIIVYLNDNKNIKIKNFFIEIRK